MNDETVEKKCPRCGYMDHGKYCSQCSHPLDREVTSVFKEMYHSFFLKYFHDKPVLRFMRTWWRAFVKPGSINYQASFKADSKYMNDIQFAKTIFFLALGTTILKMFVTTSDRIERLIMSWFFQTYVLWIFCFTLAAFIWTGRAWKRFMKMDVKDQRSFDGMYIYEYGFFLTIVYVISLLYGSEIEKFTSTLLSTKEAAPVLVHEAGTSAQQEVERLISGLKNVGIALSIIFVVHFLWFHISIGIREKLPMIKLLLVSILSIYLLVFFMVAAEIITIPLAFSPILFLLSPFYYPVRNVSRRARTWMKREAAPR